MHIEIDQSGKIEQLNKDTVVAFSNEHQYSVLIKKSIKREIFVKYKSKVKNLRYKLFCLGIYYCIKNYLNNYHSMVIDFEYQGKENLIKSILLYYIRSTCGQFNSKLIRFGSITKNSNAHAAAIDAYRGHRKPNLILTLKDIEKWLKKG
jgi:hypothetical protein